LPSEQNLQQDRRHSPIAADHLLPATCLTIAAICLGSSGFLPYQRSLGIWLPAIFVSCGVLLSAIGVMNFCRWLSTAWASRLTMALVAGLMLIRLLNIFDTGAVDDPAHTVFLPVFSYYVTLYLLAVVLLPYPLSARCSVVAWLSMALITTAGTHAYWFEQPARELLGALLIYVWLGHGLFLLLLFGWAGRLARLARSQTETARTLAASELRFRTVFEQSAAGISLIDANRVWLDANQRMAELTGYSVDELRGRQLKELLPEHEREAACQRVGAFLSATSGSDQLVSERQWLRRDGTRIWLANHLRRIPATADHPARGLLMTLDISERKRAEALVIEERRLRDFQFEHSPHAMIEWSPQLLVQRWSPQAKTLFGWSEQEVLGQNPWEWGFFFEDDFAHTLKIAERLVYGVDHRSSMIQRIRRKDGSEGWCQWHHACLRDASGRLESIHSTGSDVSELRIAMQALEGSERRLRAVFEQAAVGMSLLNADGSWNQVNQRLCEITGYSAEELLASNYQAITLPEDLPIDSERARQLIEGEIDSYDVEKRFVHKWGAIVWVKVFASRIDATPSQKPLYVAVVEDISERRRAEAAAAEHQRVRDFHFENTPLGVVEWTPDLKVKRWSSRAAELFGWSEAEVIGRNPFDWRFVHEDDREASQQIAESLFAGDQTLVTTRNRNYCKDGSVVWCHWYNSMLRDQSGEIVSFYSLVNDVSDEHLALEALGDSQMQFRSIFEQAAVGIAMLDADGHWLMVNRRFCRIVGYSELELLQQSCQDITYQEDRALDAARRASLLAGETDDYRIEKRYRRRDGSLVWVSLFARRLDAVGNGPVRLTLVIEDISERKEAEASLQRLHVDLERKVAERTRQLQDTMRGWVERNGELRTLAEMTGVLQAAADSAEANSIVAHFLPLLFRRFTGAVWMDEGQLEQYTRLASWGPEQGLDPPPVLATRECWGLRLSRPLHVEKIDDPLACAHLGAVTGRQSPHACIPILASGDAVGLINLQWSERFDAETTPPDRVLVTAAAEQIGLAIGNVRLREELRRQAMRDPLTGLCNRRTFEDVIARRTAPGFADRVAFVLLLIDIDHFKAINDRFGHDAGDEALVATAKVLERMTRGNESAFRLGGEEFVMILEEGADIAGRIDAIRAEVEAQRLSHRRTALPVVTVSIGVAVYPVDATDSSALLKAADTAMYTAKRNGRNCVVYAAAMTPKSGSPLKTVVSKNPEGIQPRP
jgi:diguanylate cyclase (GGDEF)-like protein/PAS domain S-box-containing protein